MPDRQLRNSLGDLVRLAVPSCNSEWSGLVPRLDEHLGRTAQYLIVVQVEASVRRGLLEIPIQFVNVSLEDGTWWELSWIDAGHRGLLSEWDVFSVRTNSVAQFEIRIFDHWAQSWTDQVE